MTATSNTLRDFDMCICFLFRAGWEYNKQTKNYLTEETIEFGVLILAKLMMRKQVAESNSVNNGSKCHMYISFGILFLFLFLYLQRILLLV